MIAKRTMDAMAALVALRRLVSALHGKLELNWFAGIIESTERPSRPLRRKISKTKMEKVNLKKKLAIIDEHWRPKVVGELNGQEVKVVKFLGEFPWHQHENEDEMFMGLRGKFRLEFRDKSVEVNEGEFVIVPRGVEHRPVANEEVHVLLFEPANLKNTGNIDDEIYTAPVGEKI